MSASINGLTAGKRLRLLTMRCKALAPNIPCRMVLSLLPLLPRQPYVKDGTFNEILSSPSGASITALFNAHIGGAGEFLSTVELDNASEAVQLLAALRSIRPGSSDMMWSTGARRFMECLDPSWEVRWVSAACRLILDCAQPEAELGRALRKGFAEYVEKAVQLRCEGPSGASLTFADASGFVEITSLLSLSTPLRQRCAMLLVPVVKAIPSDAGHISLGHLVTILRGLVLGSVIRGKKEIADAFRPHLLHVLSQRHSMSVSAGIVVLTFFALNDAMTPELCEALLPRILAMAPNMDALQLAGVLKCLGKSWDVSPMCAELAAEVSSALVDLLSRTAVASQMPYKDMAQIVKRMDDFVPRDPTLFRPLVDAVGTLVERRAGDIKMPNVTAALYNSMGVHRPSNVDMVKHKLFVRLLHGDENLNVPITDDRAQIQRFFASFLIDHKEALSDGELTLLCMFLARQAPETSVIPFDCYVFALRIFAKFVLMREDSWRHSTKLRAMLRESTAYLTAKQHELVRSSLLKQTLMIVISVQRLAQVAGNWTHIQDDFLTMAAKVIEASLESNADNYEVLPTLRAENVGSLIAPKGSIAKLCPTFLKAVMKNAAMRQAQSTKSKQTVLQRTQKERRVPRQPVPESVASAAVGAAAAPSSRSSAARNVVRPHGPPAHREGVDKRLLDLLD